MLRDIEKMYETVGIEKTELDYPDNLEPFYPEFTAEKQIRLIKLITLHGSMNIENWEERGYNLIFKAVSTLRQVTYSSVTRKTFTEALARIVNDIWDDLTKEEKAEIRKLLNT